MPPRRPSLPEQQPLAVAYARQSKTDAEEATAGNSLSSRNQITRCQTYCQLHGFCLDLELSRACVDLDTSGGAKEKDRRRGVRSWQKRPGLMRLYEAAKERQFQHLVVYDMNRLGGNATELHLIREAFEDLGITIHFVNQGLRTDSPSGDLVFSVFASVAQQRLRDISVAFRDNARQRAEEGKQHGRPPGWIEPLPSFAVTPEQVAAETQARGPRGTIGWYRLHEALAPVYREIVAYRMAGLPYSQIAARLNDPEQEGGARATPTGRRWTAQLVAQALDSDNRLKMRGCSVYGRLRRSGDPLRLVTPGVFPALLSPEEAEALEVVQTALVTKHAINKNGNGERDTRLQQKTTLLCAGLARCALCGERLRSTVQTDRTHADGEPRRYWAYRCMAAGDKTAGVPHPTIRAGSRTMSMAQEKLDSAVIHALAQLALRLPELPRSARKRGRPEKPAGRPKRTVEEITAAIDSLLDLHAAGRVGQGDFDRRYEALGKEREAAAAWEETQRRSGEQEQGLVLLTAATQSGSGLRAQEGGPPCPPDQDQPDLATLRLILRLLASHIDCPVYGAADAGSSRRRIHSTTGKPTGGRERAFVRIHLKQPLPDGTTSILSGLYRAAYQGRRTILFEQQHTLHPT